MAWMRPKSLLEREIEFRWMLCFLFRWACAAFSGEDGLMDDVDRIFIFDLIFEFGLILWMIIRFLELKILNELLKPYIMTESGSYNIMILWKVFIQGSSRLLTQFTTRKRLKTIENNDNYDIFDMHVLKMLLRTNLDAFDREGLLLNRLFFITTDNCQVKLTKEQLTIRFQRIQRKRIELLKTKFYSLIYYVSNHY